MRCAELAYGAARKRSTCSKAERISAVLPAALVSLVTLLRYFSELDHSCSKYHFIEVGDMPGRCLLRSVQDTSTQVKRRTTWKALFKIRT